MLDRVGDGLPGRDQDVLGYPGAYVAAAQPAAQRGPHRGELLRLRGEQDVERGGMVVEHHGHVVLVASGGNEPRHELAGELLQRGFAALVHGRPGRGYALGQRLAPPLDQAVGVQQQRRTGRQDVVGFGPRGVLPDGER